MNRFVKSFFAVAILASVLVLFTNAASYQVDDQGRYVFSYNLETTYGESSRLLAPQLQEAVDAVLKQDCYNTNSPKGAAGYGCGEYPIGKPLNANVKRLDDFIVKFKKGMVLVKYNEGDIRLKDDFQLKILLDRAQKQSQVDVALLDVKKKSPLVVRNRLFETVTLQHTPKGNALYTMACTYFPGVNLATDASDFNIDIKYTWKFLFFSGTERASSYTKIKDGKFSIDNAKICAILKSEFVNAAPKVTVMDISYPEVGDLKVTSSIGYDTRVDLQTLGLKIAGFVLKLFGVGDIEKMIAQQIEQHMQREFDGRIKIMAGGLKTGRLFETLFNESLNKKLTRDITAAYKRVTTAQFEDAKPIHFEENLSNTCYEAIKSHSLLAGLPLADGAIRAFCADVYAWTDIVPFDPAAKFKSAGCYDYAYSPLAYGAPEKNGWWQNGCALSAKAKITVSPPNSPAILCFNKIKYVPGQPLDLGEVMQCISKVEGVMTGVPADFLKEIQKRGLKNLTQIQALARQRGVPENIVKNLGQVFK